MNGNGNPTSRDYNKAMVLDVVLSRAPLTRNELIELTGLSKASVSRAVEDLRADGFLVDSGLDAVASRGRWSTYLHVPGTTGHVVGISFGIQSTAVLVPTREVATSSTSSCPPRTTGTWRRPRSG